MKNIIKFILLIIILSIFAIYSCSNTNETIENNEYITVKMNETIVDNNNTITVSFLEVSDKRCSKSACYLCYGSRADIFLSITDSEKTKVEIDLSIIGCVDEFDSEYLNNHIDTLGYRFKLVRLLPYPDIEPINEDDYIAKIKITKL